MLVISATGYGLGLVPKMTREGHAVSVCVNREVSISDVLPIVNTATPDIAIFDSHTQNTVAEWFRSRGVKVIGTSNWSNILATNEQYKDSIIKAIGYTPATPATKGTRCSVLVLFNGQRFITKCLIFNYTHMMAGDVGVPIDSSGYVVHFKVDNSPLINTIISPLEKFLRRAGHKGCFVIDTISNKEGIFVEDISADMNKPYVQAVFENARKNKSDILLDILNESSGTLVYNEPWVCGVMLSVYPYPHAIPPERGVIYGITPANIRHMWIIDATHSEGNWVCGDLSGCLGYIVARGSSVEEAKRRAYRTISNLEIENVQYRTDISKDVNDRMYQLRRLKLV